MKFLPSTNHGCRNNQSDNASRLLPFPRPRKPQRAPNESSSKLRSLHPAVVSPGRREPPRDLAFRHRRLNIASKRWASTRRNLSFAERPTNPPNSPDSPDLPNSPTAQHWISNLFSDILMARRLPLARWIEKRATRADVVPNRSTF